MVFLRVFDLSSILTNDLPSGLNTARMVMYVNDSTMYSAASTYQKLTEILSTELRTVAEWDE